MSYSQGVGRYRKLPVEVEAVQLSWRNWTAVSDFLGDANYRISSGPDVSPSDRCGELGPSFLSLEVTTVHGDTAFVRHGDWIIHDAKPGTFYPCNPEVFAATYEPAPDYAPLAP